MGGGDDDMTRESKNERKREQERETEKEVFFMLRLRVDFSLSLFTFNAHDDGNDYKHAPAPHAERLYVLLHDRNSFSN